MAKKDDRGINLVQIYLWQCLMHKLDIVPISVLRYGNILSKRDIHMFNFSLFHFVGHRIRSSLRLS